MSLLKLVSMGSALESLLPKLGAISKTKFRSLGGRAASIETSDFDFWFLC